MVHPDGTSAIAIPSTLAHPRLSKPEEAQMLEVEGGEHEWCMRIPGTRPATLITRLTQAPPKARQTGPPTEPYPEFYTPKPYSKSFVLHLDAWYAQSHPDEDFAETFAVWLTPTSEWRQRYAGWPALKKLECMDELMTSIRQRPPRVTNQDEIDALYRLRRTLRQHYRNKRRYYGIDYPHFYDRDLRRLFSEAPELENMTAAQFRTHPTTNSSSRGGMTGIYLHTIDKALLT
jgi:hypothetical protein